MRGPITEAELDAWARGRGEPDWLRARRLAAREQAEDAGADWDALAAAMDAPPLAPPPLAPELAAQGISLTTLREAAARAPSLVEPRLGTLSGRRLDPDAVVNEAFWTDGYFVRVPAGVRAALPLQLGADLSRAPLERAVVIVEDSAELSLVEGCTAPVGASGLRSSVLEAFVGRGARLSGASLQAWPPGVTYAAAKLARADEGGRVEWLDGNLGAASVRKRLRLDLAGAGSRGDLLACAFAGPGQSTALDAYVYCAPGSSARADTLCASGGGGRASAARHFFLSDAAIAVDGEDRRLRLEDTGEDLRFYLATRGLEGAAADAVLLHAFFEPFARRLPLEFSVEFSRLLDAELHS